jgi:hypothetical protein
MGPLLFIMTPLDSSAVTVFDKCFVIVTLTPSMIYKNKNDLNDDNTIRIDTITVTDD